MFRKSMVAMATGLLLSGIASASLISDVGGGNGSEPNLQEIIDGFTVGGESSVDVYNDYLGNSGVWNNVAADDANARFYEAYAGYHNNGWHDFGIYDVNDPGTKFSLFSGEQIAGERVGFTVWGNGWVTINGDEGTPVATFSSKDFGFYLANTADKQDTFYSQDSLNPNGDRQMVAYEGTGQDYVTVPSLNPNLDGDERLWTPNNWFLAWEDIEYQNSDRDFNDMVVFVSQITPVPEPGTLALLGLGIGGLAAARRRQSRKMA